MSDEFKPGEAIPHQHYEGSPCLLCDLNVIGAKMLDGDYISNFAKLDEEARKYEMDACLKFLGTLKTLVAQYQDADEQASKLLKAFGLMLEDEKPKSDKFDEEIWKRRN